MKSRFIWLFDISIWTKADLLNSTCPKLNSRLACKKKKKKKSALHIAFLISIVGSFIFSAPRSTVSAVFLNSLCPALNSATAAGEHLLNFKLTSSWQIKPQVPTGQDIFPVLLTLLESDFWFCNFLYSHNIYVLILSCKLLFYFSLILSWK